MKKPRPLHLVVLAGLMVGLSLAFAAGLQNGSAYRYLNVFQEVWAMTRGNYVEPVDEAALLAGAYEGMAASLDASSGYLPPGKEKLLDGAPAEGSAGMEILPAGGVPVIVRLDPLGPAEKAGLEVGDQIWRIGGQPVRKYSWPVLTRLTRGPAGSTLDLTVLEGRNFKVKQVKVALEKPTGRGYDLETRPGPVLYLRLRDLARVDPGQLRQDLGRASAANASAPLLLDLRGAVSLDLQPLVRLSGLLFPGGTLLKLVPRKGKEETVSGPEAVRPLLPRHCFGLVDGTTAGVGEALAALFKERQGARLGGRPTYGMAGLPERIPLSQGGALLLSTREMRSASGTAWARKGIEPEKILSPPSGAAETPADPLLEEALRWARAEAALKPAA